MAKQIKSPKSTGGGGYLFEDKVVAYFLCCMLTDSPPFDPEDGSITRIDFQCGRLGWHLDDVLLLLETSNTKRRCAVSIKSNRQITQNGFQQEFILSCWEQYLGGEPFEISKDMLCLVTAPLGLEVRDAVDELLQWSRVQKPSDLKRGLEQAGSANRYHRAVFDSCSCPEDLRAAHGLTDDDIGKLLSHVRVLKFDFQSDPSDSVREAIRMCRNILRSNSARDAQLLWEWLCRIAADSRPLAGSLVLPKLIDQLRFDFKLRDFPTHEDDWTKLCEQTGTSLQRISDTIGGAVRVDRPEDLQRIGDSVRASRITLIAGPSGCGKTVLAKKFAESISERATVIWWNAGLLAHGDLTSFEGSRHLTYTLKQLLSSFTGQEAYLILDGLDRQFDRDTFANLAVVMTTLRLGDKSSPWRVVISTQVEEVHRLQRELALAGVKADLFQIVPIKEPTWQELQPVWREFPALGSLSLRPELHRLLLKPKMLQLFATNIADAPVSEISGWTGESDLIVWFWENVVRKGPSGATRDSFVKRLAQRQADECASELPGDSFGVGETAPLGELICDRICTCTDERYTFEHDLFGDWARQRILVGRQSNLADYVDEKLDSPVWHRAVQLLGLHLLERRSVDEWVQVWTSLPHEGDQRGLAQDLMLQAVIFAANPLPLLEQMWPVLSQDEGKLLNRLLAGFLLVATFPNRAIQVTLASLYPESATHARTLERIPFALYWPPIIRFLHNHSDDVLRLAPLRAAEVAEKWLQYSESGLPCRTEAADLALEQAEDRLASKMVYWRGVPNEKLDRVVFKGALKAYSEYPERTVAFALTACGRRPPSDRMKAKIEYQRRLNPLHADSDCLREHTDEWVEVSWRQRYRDPDAQPPDPWPDGPSRIVDEGFAETCLTTDAVLRLAATDPAVAKEIVLACLIETPSDRMDEPEMDNPLAKLGLSMVDQEYYPPFWTRSPFWLFLGLDPSEAVNLIIRLVDFVTERWASKKRAHKQQVFEIEVTIPGGQRTFVGDKEVAYWFTDSGTAPHSVVTALMALEKWLYDTLDREESVSEAVDQILGRAKSTAFLGLLSCVGKRYPQLFLKELQPLLAIPELYLWDAWHQSQGQGLQMLPWGGLNQPEVLVRLAKEWHSMEHRRVDLLTVAFYLLVDDKGTQDFFISVREQWRNLLEEGACASVGAGFLRRLIDIFDPANLRQVRGAEGEVIVYSEGMLSQSPEYEAVKQDLETKQILLTMPYRCRRLLSGEDSLSEEELEGFLAQVQSIPSLQIPDAFDLAFFGPENCVTGGAAVLVRHHREWLRKHPDRERWCVEHLVGIVLNPPGPSPVESELTYVDLRWQGFCAHAIPMLWAEQPDSRELRLCTARLGTDEKYDTVRILFESAARFRQQLGSDLKRLQHLVMRWAAARPINTLIQRSDSSAPNVPGWLDNEIEQFCQGSMLPEVPEWKSICDSVNAALPYSSPFDWTDESNKALRIDLLLVMAANAWIPSLNKALTSEERADWIHLFEEALNYSMEIITEILEAGGKLGYANHEWYEWLFRRLVRVIPELSQKEKPDRFWKPILELGVDGHYRIESFLSWWFIENLQSSPPPGRFLEEWQRMVDFAFQSPHWSFEEIQHGFYDLQKMWCNVMGFGAAWVKMWSENHRSVIEAMRPNYQKWAKEFLDRPQCGSSFAILLEQEGARGLVLDGLVWLEQAVAKRGEGYFREEKVRRIVLSCLDTCWSTVGQEIRRNEAAFSSLKKLLRILADRQERVAIEMLRTIAETC